MRDEAFASQLETASLRWDAVATAALLRILEESGKPLGHLASDMGMKEHTLERLQRGAMPWSKRSVLKLAAVSGQDPGQMLGREALP